MDRAARDTHHAFDGAGLPAGLVAHTQLDDALLAAARLVVFPYNPGLPPAAAEPLGRFAARGGACLAFYQAPAPLAEILGIRVTGWRKESPATLHAIAFAPGALCHCAAEAQARPTTGATSPSVPRAARLGRTAWRSGCWCWLPRAYPTASSVRARANGCMYLPC